MAGLRSAAVFLLCLLLAGWSVDATLMHSKQALSQSKQESKISTKDEGDEAADSDDGNSDRDDDDDDDADADDDSDDSNKDDDSEDNKDDDSKDTNDDESAGSNQDAEAEADAALAQIDQPRSAQQSQKVALIARPVHKARSPQGITKVLAEFEKANGEADTLLAKKIEAEADPKAGDESFKFLTFQLPKNQQALMTYQVPTNQQALSDNQQKQDMLEQRLAHLTDPAKSEAEIEQAENLVANETESPAMANMLGSMWKEMRMFEVPLYKEHAEEELHHLKKEEVKLEAKIAAESKKADDEDKKKSEAAGAEKKAAAADEEESTKDDKKKSEAEDDDKEHVVNSETGKLVTDEDPAEQIETDVQEVNFWRMSSKKQKSFLGGWGVYVVGGLLLAYLHNKARQRNPNGNVFLAKPRSDVTRSPADFSFSIFGCFGAINVCLMGCFCPCLQWADTNERHHFTSYWKAFLMFFLMTALYGFTYGIAPLVVVAMGVYYRQKLRATYQIEHKTARSVVCDVLAWVCCQPCAIIQEAREESVLLGPGP